MNSQQPQPRAPAKIGHYILGARIGQGSFSSVRIAYHERTNHRVAIKIISKSRVQSLRMESKVQREINILKMFRHPHIIKLYDVLETNLEIFLVLEYVPNGELFKYIHDHVISVQEARKFFQQIISAVACAHRRLVSHRDLKPENLLLDANYNIKVTDFGLSNLMTDGDLLKTSCGSPNYAAPELISGQGYQGSCVDIWSCGVILYALLTRSLPFDDRNIPVLFQKIRAGHVDYPSSMEQSAKDLISHMLNVNPTQRITLDEIRCHPWFIEGGVPVYINLSFDLDLETIKYTQPSEEILIEMERIGYKRAEVIQALKSESQSANQIIVVYRLMLDAMQEQQRNKQPKAQNMLQGPGNSESGTASQSSDSTTEMTAFINEKEENREENWFMALKTWLVQSGCNYFKTNDAGLVIAGVQYNGPPLPKDQLLTSEDDYKIIPIPQWIFNAQQSIVLSLAQKQSTRLHDPSNNQRATLYLAAKNNTVEILTRKGAIESIENLVLNSKNNNQGAELSSSATYNGGLSDQQKINVTTVAEDIEELKMQGLNPEVRVKMEDVIGTTATHEFANTAIPLYLEKKERQVVINAERDMATIDGQNYSTENGEQIPASARIFNACPIPPQEPESQADKNANPFVQQDKLAQQQKQQAQQYSLGQRYPSFNLLSGSEMMQLLLTCLWELDFVWYLGTVSLTQYFGPTPVKQPQDSEQNSDLSNNKFEEENQENDANENIQKNASSNSNFTSLVYGRSHAEPNVSLEPTTVHIPPMNPQAVDPNSAIPGKIIMYTAEGMSELKFERSQAGNKNTYTVTIKRKYNNLSTVENDVIMVLTLYIITLTREKARVRFYSLDAKKLTGESTLFLYYANQIFNVYEKKIEDKALEKQRDIAMHQQQIMHQQQMSQRW